MGSSLVGIVPFIDRLLVKRLLTVALVDWILRSLTVQRDLTRKGLQRFFVEGFAGRNN